MSLQTKSEEFNTLQNEQSNLIQARSKLDSQRQENLSVQNEFNGLNEEAKVFKLVGPVLLKQDLDEAKTTVSGRLEFIGNEIKRVEREIEGNKEKSETLRGEIMSLQAQQQQYEGGTA
ncbi:Prefoldin beta-like protein [Piedraia hortae CBS 480.64]|uniref:Prefoldin beta-like protein n=1 Tax=Piedraia hortae CBS 480.64 TaxID=1314780 RepID=A0A6A7BWQ7_9PEZI|nr:Prefoldin beta-like protein [Piedraia hortae CBS 480.64]